MRCAQLKLKLQTTTMNTPENAQNSNDRTNDSTTHFGYKTIAEDEKESKVAEVFHSVASKYDIMNDVMSGGMPRLWKFFTINRVAPRPGMKMLDLASGTADLAIAFAKKVGESGEVWATDINESMLRVGRDRLLDKGLVTPVALANAEHLPFADNYFDVVTVAFGLRNMTHKEQALKEMHRVLRPGGRVFVLEFSKVNEFLQKPYDFYSFNVLPKMGELIANDADSYQYLAESIRMHPDQETLKGMMQDAGFEFVKYHNMTFGVCALHEGVKL